MSDGHFSFIAHANGQNGLANYISATILVIIRYRVGLAPQLGLGVLPPSGQSIGARPPASGIWPAFVYLGLARSLEFAGLQPHSQPLPKQFGVLRIFFPKSSPLLIKCC